MITQRNGIDLVEFRQLSHRYTLVNLTQNLYYFYFLLKKSFFGGGGGFLYKGVS